MTAISREQAGIQLLAALDTYIAAAERERREKKREQERQNLKTKKAQLREKAIEEWKKLPKTEREKPVYRECFGEDVIRQYASQAPEPEEEAPREPAIPSIFLEAYVMTQLG